MRSHGHLAHTMPSRGKGLIKQQQLPALICIPSTPNRSLSQLQGNLQEIIKGPSNCMQIEVHGFCFSGSQGHLRPG